MRLSSVTFNEAQTRVLHIDPQLRAADWKLNDRTQVRLEVPVDGYDAEPWNGVTDYCLYDATRDVLAVGRVAGASGGLGGDGIKLPIFRNTSSVGVRGLVRSDCVMVQGIFLVFTQIF